jgi:hypothetical protein
MDGTKKFHATNHHVGFSNLTLHSLFRNSSLHLGGIKIEGDTHLAPLSAYLSTLLGYSHTEAENQLALWGFKKDTPGHMTAVAENLGLKQRIKMLKNGGGAADQHYTAEGPLMFDFCGTERYLLGNVPLEVKLEPATSEFTLMNWPTTGDGETPVPVCKIVLNEVLLRIRKVKLSPSVIMAHESGLVNFHALYPFRRSEPRTFTMPQGIRSYTAANLFNDRIPKMVIVGMVLNSQLNGTVLTSPFDFKPFDVRSVDLQVDGQSVPRNPSKLNFAGSCHTAYNDFIQAMGLYRCGREIPISLEEYKDGHTLFAFNLAPDQKQGDFDQEYKKGVVNLELTFGTETPDVINVVVMAFYDSQVAITQMRNVLKNY